MPKGWTPVPESAASGWTPVPDFKSEVVGNISGAPIGAPAEQPSARGFLANLLSSGANFAENVVSPIAHPIQTAQGLREAISQPTLTGKLIRDAVMKRYGSVDAFLKTLYTDPVGAASDASLVLGGAATAARAAGSLKSAQAIGAMAEALNPLSVPSKLGQSAGRVAYQAAINPSRAIRRSFPNAMEAGYQNNILPTEGGVKRAEDALLQSATHTDTQLAAADAAGAPPVTAAQIAPALGQPIVKAGNRAIAGLPDEAAGLQGRQAVMAQRMGQGVPLTRAQDIKQEMQGLANAAFRAQEKGTIINDLDALANKNVASAYQKAIEANAASVGINDIAESNRKTQALIGLTRALEDATQQPTRLSHLMATLEGVGGAMGGGLGVGAGAYAATRLATAKPIMAGAGLAVGKSSKLLRNAQIMRALAVLGASSANGKGTAEQQQASQ